MTKTNDIKIFFEKNPDVQREILDYINYSFENKRFDLPDKDKMQKAFENNLFEELEGKYLVKEDYFNWAMVKYLQDRNNIIVEDIKSLEEFQRFIYDTQDEFNKVNDSWERFNGFISYVLIYLNNDKKFDFKTKILDVKKDNKNCDFFGLMFHYTNTLPRLIVEKKDLLLVLEHMLEEAKADLSKGILYTSIQEYCKEQKEAGIEFIDYLIEQKKTEFLPNSMIGLSESDFNYVFEKAKEIFSVLNLKEEAIVVLGTLKYNDITQFEESLNLLLSVENNNEDIGINVALGVSFINMMDNENASINENLQKIIIKLESLSKFEEPIVQYNIVSSLTKTDIKIHRNEKFQILLNIKKVNQENKGIIDKIDYMLAKLRKPDMVLKYVTEYILSNKAIDQYNLFSFSIRESYKSFESEFIQEFIQMLIHPKGEVRFFTNQKTDYFNMNNSNKEFWKEHLYNLSSRRRIKFVKSILSGFFEIEKKIRLSVLIIKQCDEKIFNELLQQYVWLFQDFSEMVKNILESELDFSVKYEERFFKEFMFYYNKFIEVQKQKYEIKEFNPKINQAKHYNKYNELYSKHNSENIRKGIYEKSTFLKLFKRVSISRGDRFGTEGEEGYSSMMDIKKEFPLPRTLIAFPEMYDFVRRKELLEDWSEEND